MQAQHLAFILSYFYGISTPTTYGNGKKHSILPMSGRDMATFTSAMRYGKNIGKTRFASNAVDSWSLECAKDAWAKLNSQIKGTGRYEDNVIPEVISAAFNATTLTLAANAVQGSDANSRLASIHEVYAIDPVSGAEIYTTCSAVSSATPAVLTIVAPGVAATVTNFHVYYVPAEPAWCTFPSQPKESGLRTSNMLLQLGGLWTGSEFVGGKAIDSDLKTMTLSGNNNVAVEFRPGGNSGDGEYANYLKRGSRVQKINLDEELTSWLLQMKARGNATFGVMAQLLGAEFDTGKRYGGKLVYPRCGIVDSPIENGDGDVIYERGDIQVLEDTTYGSVIGEVYNQVAGYAQ